MFLRSLCQCVCSSNTGFSPHYPPPPPLFFSPHLQWLHIHLSTSNRNFVLYFSYLLYFYVFHTLPVLSLTNSSPLTSTCLFVDPFIHSLTHSFIHSFTHPSYNLLWFPPPDFLHQPPSSFPLLLISGLSLSPFSTSLTLSTSSPPPFLPSSLSLSHSALCLALSGWAAPRWLRVCVHSGACRASPPPGLTTRFCLSPLISAAPPLPSLPFFPRHLFTFHFSSPTPHDSSYHFCADSTHSPPSPSYLLTFRCPFFPAGSTLLSGSSLVCPQTL